MLLMILVNLSTAYAAAIVDDIPTGRFVRTELRCGLSEVSGESPVRESTLTLEPGGTFETTTDAGPGGLCRRRGIYRTYARLLTLEFSAAEGACGNLNASPKTNLVFGFGVIDDRLHLIRRQNFTDEWLCPPERPLVRTFRRQ